MTKNNELNDAELNNVAGGTSFETALNQSETILVMHKKPQQLPNLPTHPPAKH